MQVPCILLTRSEPSLGKSSSRWDLRRCRQTASSRPVSGISMLSLFPSNIQLVIYKIHSIFQTQKSRTNPMQRMRMTRVTMRHTGRTSRKSIKKENMAPLVTDIRGRRMNHYGWFFELTQPQYQLLYFTNWHQKRAQIEDHPLLDISPLIVYSEMRPLTQHILLSFTKSRVLLLTTALLWVV